MEFWQGEEEPETLAVPGVGLTVTDWQPCVPLPQLLEGVAQTCPEDVPTVTLIEEVPCPELMVQPAGQVQLKAVAFVAVAV